MALSSTRYQNDPSLNEGISPLEWSNVMDPEGGEKGEVEGNVAADYSETPYVRYPYGPPALPTTNSLVPKRGANPEGGNQDPTLPDPAQLQKFGQEVQASVKEYNDGAVARAHVLSN